MNAARHLVAFLWLAIPAVGCSESFAGDADRQGAPQPPAAQLPAARASGSDPTGGHTRRVGAACSLFVSSRGRDAHDGRSLRRAFKTPDKAVSVAGPGDVVCFDAGTYPTLEIAHARGTVSAPIVFRTVLGAEHRATFTSGSLKYGAGVHVELSEHIHLYDLRLTNSQTGIHLRSTSYIRLERLLIESVGQEAIHVGRKVAEGGKKRFLGAAAHHCDVIGNTIRDTGRVTPRYGEGIYVGTGGFPGDDTHDVYVAYNRLDAVRAEAIELKPFGHDHVVRGNLVTSGSHEFHAAITVAVQAKPDSVPNGHYLIEDNRIYDYASTGSSVAGITVGHGDAIVRNNVIWAIDGGRGIRTTTTFANLSAREVVIEHNTIWTSGGAPSIALDDGHERTGVTDQLGHATVRDNVTSDGSAGSTRVSTDHFLGPITGSADAGEGPGSGFRAKRYAGVGADLDAIIGRGAESAR